MSRHVEFNEGGGRPLVKAYTRNEARRLFSMFRVVSITIEQLTRPEFYFPGQFIPESLFRRLRRTVGWNVIISAQK